MARKPDTKIPQNRMVLGEMQAVAWTGEIFNHVDKGLPMWSGHGDRKVSFAISFEVPFGSPPIVSLSLSGIDSAHDQNLRFRMSTKDVTPQGFSIDFDSWSDTHIARAEVSWLAIGPVATVVGPTKAV